jgi:PAS domain S-box-containing protein
MNILNYPLKTPSTSQKGEGSVNEGNSFNAESLSKNEAIKLIQELKAQLSEIERQNDELITSEETAKKTINKLTILYDFAPMGYFIFDQDGIIGKINVSGAKMLGNVPGALIKMPFSQFVASDLRKLFSQFLARIFESGIKETCQLQLDISGDSSTFIHMEGVAVGESRECLVTAINITEHKQAADALKESEKHLREINASKDKFFTIISHDLRSPFSSIIGFSNLLIEKVRKKEYQKVEEYAGIIQNSSWRVMNLLINLIEWASSQTGRIKFNPEYVDIVDLINEVTELLNDSARQKSIAITGELPGSIIVFADKDMLSTVIRNLLSNAIKYTYPGGKINIVAKQNHGELIVSVSDNGVGILAESVEKLFRIEESHSTTGTQKEYGTGLGLLVCKEFIGKHDGRIWVDSEPGKGSTFYFKLPVSR